ncbi:MAG: YncE family protein [Bryobacteraceae bacterium]|jgi:YVTN family beta-propeller protein
MRKTLCFLGVLAVILCGQTARDASLVVTEKISGKIGFYNPAGRCVSETKVGLHPHEMVFSPDRRFLYVTNNGVLLMTEEGDGENTVSIVDIPNRRSLGMIDLGRYRRPHGIDVDPVTGNVLVTTEKPSALLLVDPRSRKILNAYDVKGEAPHMVLLGPDRKWAFVSNTNTGAMAAVDLQTSEITLIPTGPRPQGAAFSPDKKTIYVANSGGESISIVDAVAKKHAGEIATGKGPVRIAITPDGETLIYALQLGTAVGFADAKRRRETGQIPLPGQPVSLTLSADRKLAYCAVQMEDKIFVVSIADRKIVRVVETPKGSGPDPVFELP